MRCGGCARRSDGPTPYSGRPLAPPTQCKPPVPPFVSCQKICSGA
jgi:hypothetical protein